MTEKKRSSAKQPRLIEDWPNPSSNELERTRDILATDGFSTESAEYGRRARVAERIENQIDETHEHVRDVERASAQAYRDFADEVSYDEHVAGRDRSDERGEHIAGWLIEHGWTPPSGFAFATPTTATDQAGVKAYSRDGYEIGRALAAVFGPHIEPHATITARMVSEDLMHVKDQRSELPDVSTPADLTAEVVNLAADVVKLLHIDNGRREGAATIPVTVTYLRDQAEHLQAVAREHARPGEDGDTGADSTTAAESPVSSDVPDPGEAETFSVPTCSLCRRERTLQDANDYNPIQVLTGQPLGWYSGDDGEVCPQCMAETLGRQG